MEISSQFKKRFDSKPQKSQYLHSPDHLLADEISKKLGETKRFGFYLKLATKNNHNLLRRILGEVSESKAKNPAALFTFLVKKENLNNSEKKQ